MAETPEPQEPATTNVEAARRAELLALWKLY